MTTIPLTAPPAKRKAKSKAVQDAAARRAKELAFVQQMMADSAALGGVQRRARDAAASEDTT